MSWSRAMGETNPDHNVTPGPGEWDQISFGNTVCPGVARVSVKLAADIDKRKPKGVKKSQAIDRGAKPADVDIELILLPGDLEEFEREIVPILFSKSKTEAQDPVEINHPMLQIWGLNLFIIKSVDMDAPSSGGTMSLKFQALEWVAQPVAVKPKTAVKTVEALATDAIGGVASTVRNAVDSLFGGG